MEEAKKLSDFIDVDLLQTIQDNCAKAMGLAFVTVDYKGIPVTRYSGFTHHCMLGRQMQGFAEMCEQCDAHGGLHAAITGQPYIYRCHADLVDFSTPLIVNGTYVGAVLGGQVRLEEESERELEYILPQQTKWRKSRELADAYQELEVVTYEKVMAAVNLMRDMVLAFIQNQSGLSRDQQMEEKDRQLTEERAARSELELAVQKQEQSKSRRQSELRSFFFVMNVISKLAYEEKAEKTEAVAYDFADMMRYAGDSEQQVSTLGEELGYIGAMLRIRKAWVRELLDYTISVPNRYYRVSCPFLVLRPIVECALEGVGEGGRRKLDFYVEEEEGFLLFQILSNETHRSVEALRSELANPPKEERASLGEADRLLKRVLGGSAGLSINERQDGRPGLVISFRLPLERNS